MIKIRQLKKEGTYLGDSDWYHNGIYTGHTKYYLHNNALYSVLCPTMSSILATRDGEIRERIGDVEYALKKYNETYFMCITTDEIYDELCKIYNVEPVRVRGEWI